jgi:hypothetical protein
MHASESLLLFLALLHAGDSVCHLLHPFPTCQRPSQLLCFRLDRAPEPPPGW